MDKPRTPVPPYAQWIVADALQLTFPDHEFDIMFCNSLIEHLGNREAQEKLAKEIQRLAPRYFVQTPHRRFPFEPHLLSPFVHWFPASPRKKMIRNLTVWGLLARPSPAQCETLINEIALLDTEEMASLFSEGEIRVESFMGMPKSVIALRG